MSPTVKAFLVASAVLAGGAVVGYSMLSGNDSGGRDSVTSPLSSPTRSHLIPPSTPATFDPPFDTILGANAAYGLYPTSVDPDCGPFAGGTAVTISGDFSVIPAPLTADEAAAAYWVYFGGVLADFDSNFDPAAVNPGNPGQFHVVTPVAPATGLVDVTMISRADGFYANMVQAFEYYEPFDILSVDPTFGPSIGGNTVVINPEPTSPFPIHEPITTAAQAASIYRVLFGANVANFDDTAGDPMTPDEIRVFAPAGTAGTTVDVIVEEIGVVCNVNTLPDAYTYQTTLLNITSVDPMYGYVKGGLDVDLIGNFGVPEPLSAAEAASEFVVRFGGFPAQFREELVGTAMVAMTADRVYVITPPHTPPVNGKIVVDVQIEQLSEPTNESTLAQSFNYVAIDILEVTPPAIGPTAGGNTVRITAFLSIPDPTLVNTAAKAYDHYGVYFGERLLIDDRALFDNAFDPPGGTGPLIPPSNDIPDPGALDALETAAQMYVIAPPHPAGFVDVWVIDMNNVPVPVQDVVTDGYEYQESGIGEWVGVSIFPPYVGALDANELLVLIETTQDTDWEDGDVFIVPQGGDPENPAHRIPLDFNGNRPISTNTVTEWTNGSSIPQILIDNTPGGASAGDLFTDGHAALYIADPDTGIIFGHNFSDLTDSGRIRDGTENGLLNPINRRHFIIDTIPPVFIWDPDPAFGGNLVNLLSGTAITLNDIAPVPPAVAVPNVFHPAPIPGIGERATSAVVDSEGEIHGTPPEFVPGTTGIGAQVFLNVASDEFTNNFDDDELDIVVFGRFVDQDIHTFYDIPKHLLDEDKYDNNNRFRQPAGFPMTAPTDRLNQPMGDSVLGGIEALWAQWVRAAGSDPIPPVLPTNTRFTGVTAGGSGVVTPSDPYFDWSESLSVEWDFFAGVNEGIPQPPGSNTLHWAIQFRSHDRAGRVSDEADNVDRLILTPQAQLRDPLHIWWMRNTSARLVPNLEGLQVFDENINFELNRGFTIPLTDLGDPEEPEPLFSYRLWRSTVPGQGGYDADYAPLDVWQPFTADTSITAGPSIAPGTIANLYPEAINHWVLIQVLGIDEAGNYGQFPVDELTYEFEGNAPPNNTGNITEFLSGSGASWMRFFLLEQESSVDTRIRPTIWYDEDPFDGDIDSDDERVILGAPTVLQAPEDITQEQIRIRFQVEAIADPIDANTEVKWTVSRRNSLGANSISGDPADPPDIDDVTGIGTIDFARDATDNPPVESIGLDLGSAADATLNGGPTTLVFRFRTVTDTTTDSTPATYSVTIVDDIEEFVESRGARDNQPIKETTR